MIALLRVRHTTVGRSFRWTSSEFCVKVCCETWTSSAVSWNCLRLVDPQLIIVDRSLARVTLTLSYRLPA